MKGDLDQPHEFVFDLKPSIIENDTGEEKKKKVKSKKKDGKLDIVPVMSYSFSDMVNNNPGNASQKEKGDKGTERGKPDPDEKPENAVRSAEGSGKDGNKGADDHTGRSESSAGNRKKHGSEHKHNPDGSDGNEGRDNGRCKADTANESRKHKTERGSEDIKGHSHEADSQVKQDKDEAHTSRRKRMKLSETSVLMGPRQIEGQPIKTNDPFLVDIVIDNQLLKVSKSSVVNGVYYQGLDSHFLLRYYRPNIKTKK